MDHDDPFAHFPPMRFSTRPRKVPILGSGYTFEEGRAHIKPRYFCPGNSTKDFHLIPANDMQQAVLDVIYADDFFDRLTSQKKMVLMCGNSHLRQELEALMAQLEHWSAVTGRTLAPRTVWSRFLTFNPAGHGAVVEHNGVIADDLIEYGANELTLRFYFMHDQANKSLELCAKEMGMNLGDADVVIFNHGNYEGIPQETMSREVDEAPDHVQFFYQQNYGPDEPRPHPKTKTVHVFKTWYFVWTLRYLATLHKVPLFEGGLLDAGHFCLPGPPNITSRLMIARALGFVQ